MNNFLSKNYQALIKGGVITLGLAVILNEAGLIIIKPNYASKPVYLAVNILSFVFCWLLTSFLISKFPIYKIIGVVGLLVAVVIAEKYLDTPFNPITFPLLILFWLGVAYLILPQFFKKYKIAILSVYVAALSYFFIVRMAPDYVENHHQNFLNFLLVPIPVFAALWVYEQWRWLRTLEADKAKAELALLKTQVNPHFFFNTLNNLYGLVVEKSTRAPEVVLKLSDMMRYTIYQGKEDLVKLTDEIDYLETYIELHKIRYQKKVDIKFTHEVDQEMQIAPLLFIILLENAFKHGVERLTEDAYIHVDLTTQGNQVFFTIENNCEPHSSGQREGIGLGNLKKRLIHIYPKRHELLIEKTNSTYRAQLSLLLDAH